MSTYKISELATIQVGYQAKGRIVPSQNGSHRLIQSKDFDELDRMHIEGLIRFEPKRNPRNYLVKHGDVLFQARGVRHFAYAVETDLQDLLVSSSFYILKNLKDSINPHFLAWMINMNLRHPSFEVYSRGTGIHLISKANLSKLEITVPDSKTQSRIATALNLAKKERTLMEKLATERKSLVNTLSLKAVESTRD